MQTTIKERIELFIKAKNLNNRKFCQTIGVSESYINSIKKVLSLEKILLISKYFPELNMDWLMLGRGEMLREKSENNPVSSSQEDTIILRGYLETQKKLIEMLEKENKELKKQLETITAFDVANVQK